MPRILVVDDEGHVRAVLADVLRASGYNVSVARSGFEAIEIAGALAPEVVMLDAHMPSMDGWATLERLRVVSPTTKVLMMSGTDCAERALASGAVAFLAKPYRRSDILREVARATGDRPGEPSRRAA